ncbi:Oidioi.mRNA.OKI2018_I69.PAR.g11025.t1.cds [Oikopleura dioica]|uniref:Carboxylic ester hydrolase n=1 Tax=Oikopleura dioica TaxID=34765 RepID=A0ABN7RTN4_OIKDI|nr:Oidioi.mRNA.OKI2018_I69.PAR.g11025.t1.cds [Oikopleura dioica]
MVSVKSKLGAFLGKSLKVQSGYVEAFLGIKYGKYEPFEPPEIVSSYPSGMIDAQKPAPFFPQNLVPTQFMVTYLPWKQSLIRGFKAAGYADIGDLHLNIFRPPNAVKKPVMVWIHGGGFYIGGASQFDPSALVHFEDVVVVAINYRLGAHGFAPEETGNNGIRDQILALEWVHQNIEDFGGDANNVTIFGESAGGMSVDCLVHSPLAEGLFHKAISQSGTLYSKIAPCDLLQAKEQYREVLKQPDDVELKSHILSLNLKDFSRAEASLFGRGPFGPVLDYDVLPVLPEDMTDEEATVPYMLGRCSGEGDALLTATIPMYLKCGLLEGFSKEMFEMVVSGTIDRLAPSCAENVDFYIQRIVDVYSQDLRCPEKIYSEIFCRWWGDLMLGIGPLKRAEEYSQRGGDVFQYEMQVIPKHSHDPDFSGKLNLKPDLMSDGMSDEDDFVPPTRVRMISLGDSGSGKSALIKRHCEKRFVGHYVQTIGIDYGAIKIKRDWHQQSQEDVSIAIFDVGGHDLFYQVRREFYEGTEAALIVFDTSCENHVATLERWKREFLQNGGNLEKCLIIVAANKTDLSSSRKLTDAEVWAEENGFKFVKTSAKTGEGVEDIFRLICSAALMEKRGPSFHSNCTREQLEAVQKIRNATNDYDVLGLTLRANRDDVDRAWKKLCRLVHPDKTSAPGAHEAIQRLNKAKEALKKSTV